MAPSGLVLCRRSDKLPFSPYLKQKSIDGNILLQSSIMELKQIEKYFFVGKYSNWTLQTLWTLSTTIWLNHILAHGLIYGLGLGLQTQSLPHCTIQKMLTMHGLGLGSLLPISPLYRNPCPSLYSYPTRAMYLIHLGVTPELKHVHIVPLYLMKENVSSLVHGVWNFMRLPAKLAGKYRDTLTLKWIYIDFFLKS